jgi:acetoacetyl-CoA synthetase
MNTPLWTPSATRIQDSNLHRFMQQLDSEQGAQLSDYDALYEWSIANPAAFWDALWRFAGIQAQKVHTSVMGTEPMPHTTWFAGSELNFAENLLKYRDDRIAIAWHWETDAPPLEISYAELYLQVAQCQAFLRNAGVEKGDRVAGFVPNRPEAIIAMLATASLGAIWSSCSPDFGFKGVLDRFGQIQPKVLFCADGYRYNGKQHSSLERVQEVTKAIASIERVVVIPLLSDTPDLSGLSSALTMPQALNNAATEVEFAPLPFQHPLYIMYSSGTTGQPKCIVHGHGGTLLQHAKELVLHTDLSRDDAIFYFTTCGWMMWNWLVSALFTGATVVLYDGSPAHPGIGRLWEMAETSGVTVFGTSPKFLSTCQKAGYSPNEQVDLSRLRALLSTGSPLSSELFDWIYTDIKADLQVASICGGTDIISCFMLGSPISPVYRGEIQKRGLGMAVKAWASEGVPIIGEKAELVCTVPFPSMPVSFWDDPQGAKYHAAYFDFYPGVWRHGDFIEVTERGGVIVYGRSDATLNPGGVRIGTAEIYRQVEAMNEVADSLVIGQQYREDTRVVLFIVLQSGVDFTDELNRKIKRNIRTNASPRHVPALILPVPEIPRTISGKKVEIAVTRLIHGDPVTNRDALANPSSLDHFANLTLG